MTLFELYFLFFQPVYPTIYRKIRGLLLNALSGYNEHVSVLDIGGRKSHYTIGIGADVIISDLPRITAMQSKLHLGINWPIINQLRKRRSNVKQIVYDDMTRTCFKDNSLDIIVCVEVLEHVKKDAAFIQNVHRILKKGGLFFMTTPNGDYVPKTIPDHERHYSKCQLYALLHDYFDSVETWGDVRSSKFYRWGRRGWSLKYPLLTLKSMLGNALNYYESIQSHGQEHRTQHLFARCQKE
ncbi:MAG: hypothetical protein NPIRA03_22660 [Nitrospirales bacterium]|nr:MAG: hypothetical protein NPIRA03_22660 [Nitrospirales bacterium]